MAPLYRKPVALRDNPYLDDVEQVRQRGRLSKPPTNTSTTSSSSLIAQLPTRRKSLNKSIYNESLPPSSNTSREALRSHLFGASNSNPDFNNSAPKKSAVALMISKYENNGSQTALSSQTSAPSTTPQRPLSNLVSTLRTPEARQCSISSVDSNEKLDIADLGTVSPASTVGESADDQAPRGRRTASFTPGIATRKPISTPVSADEDIACVVDIVVEDTEGAVVKDDTKKEAQNEWTMPPREDRPFTPAGLDYTHLGNLSLGSLRITNGRSSPSPSELLNQFKTPPRQKISRHTSSVYDSDIGTIKSKGTFKSRMAVEESEWEDADVVETDNEHLEDNLAEIRRAFSFKPGSEARFNQPSKLRTSLLNEVTESSEPRDQTARMAQEYMAELPLSPYASTEAESPEISFHEHEPGMNEVDKTEYTAAGAVQHEDHAGDDEAVEDRTKEVESEEEEPFIDESLVPSPIVPRHVESPLSFVSTHGSEATRDEKFVSAVELQPKATPRPSYERSPLSQSTGTPRPSHERSPLRQNPVTPRTSHERSPLIQTTNSSFVTLPNPRQTAKFDSGYSSTISLQPNLPPDQLRNFDPKKNSPSKQRRLEIKLPFRKSGNDNKPVFVKSTRSTTFPVPSSADIEQASTTNSAVSLRPTSPMSKAVTNSQSASPTKSNEKVRRKLVKQRRKSTADVAKELVVQRLISIDCTSIPRITSGAQQSLAMRSEAIPELERTYRTQHSDSPVNGSVLSLAPPVNNIRFPSPDPEDKQPRKRSFSRPRSWSRSRPGVEHRPKSWFGWQKDDVHNSRNAEYGMPQHIKLDDLGSVINTLGNNPYDMAYSHSHPWSYRPDIPSSRFSPHGITYDTRSRSMMDDQTASNLSKLRRRSLTERDNKRHSFDDRGGIPGRMPHLARISIDAPPVPPMLSEEEINRRLSFRQSFLAQRSPPQHREVYPDDSVSMEEPEEPPPPPPPSHSPRPMYVDPDMTNEHTVDEGAVDEHAVDREAIHEHAIEDEEDGGDLAPPPPPCHSPRPVDITPSGDDHNQDVWAAQANAWRERRMSAGEALRRSWHEDQHNPSSSPMQTEASEFVVPRKPLRSSTQPDYEGLGYGPLDQAQYTHSPETIHSPEFSSPRRLPQHPRQYGDHHHGEYIHPQQDTYAYNDSLAHYEPQYGQFHHYHQGSFQQRPQHHHSPNTDSHSRSRSRPRSHHNYDVPHSSPRHGQHPNYQSRSPSRSPNANQYPENMQYDHDRRAHGYQPQMNFPGSPMRNEQRPINHIVKTRNWLDMDSYGGNSGFIPRATVPTYGPGSRMLYT